MVKGTYAIRSMKHLLFAWCPVMFEGENELTRSDVWFFHVPSEDGRFSR